MNKYWNHEHESDVQRRLASLILHHGTTWKCGEGTEVRPTEQLTHALAHGNTYKCSTALVVGSYGYNFTDTHIPCNLLIALTDNYPGTVSVEVNLFGNYDIATEMTTIATFARSIVTILTHSQNDLLRFEFELTTRLAREVPVEYITYPAHMEKRLSECRQCWCGKPENCACCGSACDCRSDDPALNARVPQRTVEQVYAYALEEEVDCNV